MEELDVSPSSSSSSSRLKFLCSYGGRILPRPSDNHLRYVGGETRILTLPRSITFTDLKHKISIMFTTTDLVIKYQLLHEDLDALISIRNDEDVCYMIEEYDRFFSDRLFRLFIFPSIPTPADPAASPRHRYLDAINGGSSAVASGGTSPVASADSLFDAAAGGRGMGMHRVRSTPNLRGNCGSQTTSPTAYRKTGAAGGYGGVAGLKGGGGGGGFRQEIGYGCGCTCSGAQMMRKYMGLPAAMVVEGSPPRRRFHVGAPPPPIGAPMRVVWE